MTDIRACLQDVGRDEARDHVVQPIDLVPACQVSAGHRQPEGSGRQVRRRRVHARDRLAVVAQQQPRRQPQPQRRGAERARLRKTIACPNVCGSLCLSRASVAAGPPRKTWVVAQQLSRHRSTLVHDTPAWLQAQSLLWCSDPWPHPLTLAHGSWQQHVLCMLTLIHNRSNTARNRCRGMKRAAHYTHIAP